MPADAVAGLFEAITALIEAMVEAMILAVELMVEGIVLLVELALLLVGRRRSIRRPGWIVRRRQSPASRLKSLVIAVLFLAAAGYGACQYWGFTRLDFTSGGFSRPDGVNVLLVRDGTSKPATIERGKLKVLRGRWDRIEILDSRYQASGYDLTGRRMDLRLEKIQTTREIATEAVIEKAADLLRKKFGPSRDTAAPKDAP